MGPRLAGPLAADRWVGIHWPDEYGGRGASPVAGRDLQHGVRPARARCSRSTGSASTSPGPTLLAHGTDEQKQRWLPPILTADEIWCQLFSEPDAGLRPRVADDHAPSASTTAGCSRARRCGRRYAQFARWGICLARTDPDAPKHTRHLVPRRRHAGAGHRGAAARADHRRGRVQRGVLRRGVRARRPPRRRAAQRLGGREHDARPRAGHERSRSRSRSCTRCTSTSCAQLAAARGALDDVEVADALAQSFVELRVLRLHNWRTLSRLAAGHRARARSRASRSSRGPT